MPPRSKPPASRAPASRAPASRAPASRAPEGNPPASRGARPPSRRGGQQQAPIPPAFEPVPLGAGQAPPISRSTRDDLIRLVGRLQARIDQQNMIISALERQLTDHRMQPVSRSRGFGQALVQGAGLGLGYGLADEAVDKIFGSM